VEMVARLGAAPSISSSQERRVAVSLARAIEVKCPKIGGLCGHCSRDPFDFAQDRLFRSTGGCSSLLS
jgi:hypothetical protein